MTKATYEPLSNAPYVMFTVEDTGKQYKSTTDVTTSTTTTVNGVETTTTTVVAEGWDLVLTGFTIEDAQARKYQVQVPGRDGVLDLSDALGGVYYENREIEMRFSCVNYVAERFHLLASTMRNAIDGRTVRVIFSDDQAYFWRGRPQVTAEWRGRFSTIVVSMSAEPFKYSTTSSYEPWLWDSFNFVTGVITQQSDIALTGSTVTLTLPIDHARGKPTLWLNTGSAQAKLSTDKNWHTLKGGANVFPEIRQSADSAVTLMLNGTGSVGVEYRVGSL